MIYVKERELELVKLIENKYGKEMIYQLKDKSISDKYLIEVVVLGDMSDDCIFHCIELDTLEEAEKQAYRFLDIREELRKEGLIYQEE